jgi:hypothetical protein
LEVKQKDDFYRQASITGPVLLFDEPRREAVMCGLCHSPVDVPYEIDPDELIECLCGNAATHDAILEIARKFVVEVMAAMSLFEMVEIEDESIRCERCIAYLRRRFRYYVNIPGIGYDTHQPGAHSISS